MPTTKSIWLQKSVHVAYFTVLALALFARPRQHPPSTFRDLVSIANVTTVSTLTMKYMRVFELHSLVCRSRAMKMLRQISFTSTQGIPLEQRLRNAHNTLRLVVSTNSLSIRALVLNHNYGPDFFAKLDPAIPEANVVPLKQLSDVTGLALVNHYHIARTSLDAIEHIFRHDVVNQDSMEAMKTVLGRDELSSGEQDMWPGHAFAIDTPQAKFLLNTPNAKGVVWLLALHKDEFGAKIVDEIRIFNCASYRGDRKWCMYFHIDDAPDTEEG